MNEPPPVPAEAPAPIASPSLWELARTFNAVSLSSFGGGLSAWSYEMVVRRRGWLTEAEFLSATTFCRLLPGANQINLAIYVGNQLRGLAGAVAAVVGLVAIPFCLMVLLVAGAGKLESAAFRQVMAGLVAAAIGLTLSVVWRTGRKVVLSAVPFALMASTVVMSGILRLPLWLTLLTLAPLGIYGAWRQAAPAAAAPPPLGAGPE